MSSTVIFAWDDALIRELKYFCPPGANSSYKAVFPSSIFFNLHMPTAPPINAFEFSKYRPTLPILPDIEISNDG